MTTLEIQNIQRKHDYKQIYVLSSENGLFYIGQTSQKSYIRLNIHKCDRNTTSSRLLFEDGSEVTMKKLEELFDCTELQCRIAEKKWIEHYRRLHKEKLVNKVLPNILTGDELSQQYYQSMGMLYCELCKHACKKSNMRNHLKTKKHDVMMELFAKPGKNYIHEYNNELNPDHKYQTKNSEDCHNPQYVKLHVKPITEEPFLIVYDENLLI